MYDTIEHLGKSVIQHGKLNDRIYLMKLSKEETPVIINQLDDLAERENYSKICAKVPGTKKYYFHQAGYKSEAFIPQFYPDRESVFFMGKFLSEDRRQVSDHDRIKEVLETAQSKKDTDKGDSPDDKYEMRQASESDSGAISNVYKTVFKTYPFPIHDPEYILKTMNSNVVYFTVRTEDEIVAVSSAEMDIENQNVEMTDFATLPDHRGGGFATFLLREMESAMMDRGIRTAYTIARSYSFGMNITFSRTGYRFSGTLINNTNISGNIESMNIWYKHLK